MAFIGFGTFKIYYAYIFVLVLFKFFNDCIEGFNEKNYYNRNKKTSWNYDISLKNIFIIKIIYFIKIISIKSTINNLIIFDDCICSTSKYIKFKRMFIL